MEVPNAFFHPNKHAIAVDELVPKFQEEVFEDLVLAPGMVDSIVGVPTREEVVTDLVGVPTGEEVVTDLAGNMSLAG